MADSCIDLCSSSDDSDSEDERRYPEAEMLRRDACRKLIQMEVRERESRDEHVMEMRVRKQTVTSRLNQQYVNRGTTGNAFNQSNSPPSSPQLQEQLNTANKTPRDTVRTLDPPSTRLHLNPSSQVQARKRIITFNFTDCLLYTSDAADE